MHAPCGKELCKLLGSAAAHAETSGQAVHVPKHLVQPTLPLSNCASPQKQKYGIIQTDLRKQELSLFYLCIPTIYFGNASVMNASIAQPY